MAFSYFYESISFNNKSWAKRPVVPVLINGYSFTGLVDSGSDGVVIPPEVAELLQLKETDNSEICQLDGSSKKCTISNIEIEFGKGHEVYNFNSKVMVTESPRIILGRKGFFEHFKITFDESGGIVHFKSNQDNLKVFIQK